MHTVQTASITSHYVGTCLENWCWLCWALLSEPWDVLYTLKSRLLETIQHGRSRSCSFDWVQKICIVNLFFLLLWLIENGSKKWYIPPLWKKLQGLIHTSSVHVTKIMFSESYWPLGLNSFLVHCAILWATLKTEWIADIHTVYKNVFKSV